MRRLLLLPLLFAVASAQAPAPRGGAGVDAQAGTEQELRRLEREWDDAIVRKDVVALERILGEEFVYIDSAGGVNPKAALIRGVKESEAVIAPFETEEVVVRVYGETAVLTGRFTQKVTYKGQTLSGQFRYTDVYVKRDGRWQAVSAHSSRIK